MITMMKRKISAILGAWACMAAVALPASGAELMVYKSPTCGCCSKWIEHLEAHGFEVESENRQDMNLIKARNGVPREIASCHTAIVEGYVIEGHVPAEDIARLLEERPAFTGLAVPNMPIGSPGMEGPNPERYQVLGFGGEGGVVSFASHGP
jgi:hypothetical protein